MSLQPSQHDLDRIISAINESPRSKMTGALLGNLVKRAAPDLDLRAIANLSTGSGALTRFVDTHLGHVLRKIGRNTGDEMGGDIVYERIGIEPVAVSSVSAHVADTKSVWNAFVRPSNPGVIVVVNGPQGPSLHLVSDSVPPNGHEVPHVTVEEFKAISSAFVANLASAESSRALAEQLNSAETYSQFVGYLRLAGNGHFARWSKHRRDRLRQLFADRLDSIGVPPEGRDRLLVSLDESQEEAHKVARAKSGERATGLAGASQSVLAGMSENLARAAIKAAIDRMTYAEIRALPIAFGHVLDAIALLERRK